MYKKKMKNTSRKEEKIIFSLAGFLKSGKF
jgi:hypothetical protein